MNLKEFGNKLRKLRQLKGFTQAAVSEKVYVDVRTLRRIEKGESIPRFQTLDDLSRLYNFDLVKLFSEYRLENPDEFNRLMKEYEKSIYNFDQTNLTHVISKLQEINVSNSFVYSIIKQNIFVAKGISYMNNKDYYKSIDYFSKAIALQFKEFSIKDFKNFSYDEIQLRCLMNISFCYFYLGNFSKYKEILSFCYKNADISSSRYPDILNNMAILYYREKIIRKA